MSTEPTPPPSLEEVVKAVLAEAKAKNWWSMYVVPGSAVTGAVGTFVCVCWLTLLTLGGGMPAPVPPTPPAPAADIMLPATLTGPVGRAIPLEAQTKATEVKWWCADTGDLIVGHGKKAAFVAPKVGTYTVLCWTSLKGHPTDAAVCVVTVGDAPPPVPPVPPTPPVPPAPLPTDGLWVLVIEDTSARKALPSQQVAIFSSTDIRSYLDAKCATDGATKAYHFWDKDADTSKMSAVWQGAMKRPRTSLPWIIISNGKTGFEGPLPGTIADTLALLKQYGG